MGTIAKASEWEHVCPVCGRNYPHGETADSIGCYKGKIVRVRCAGWSPP